jgi:hypothetical protein
MVSPDQEKNPIMAVRPLPLLVTEQTPSLRYGIALSSKTEHNCPICGKPVGIKPARDDAASKAMHEECFVLRQMLMQSTTPTNRPRA